MEQKILQKKFEDFSSIVKLNRGDIEEVLSNLETLGRIPAPPLKEDDRREGLVNIFKKAGVENFTIDDIGNLLVPVANDRTLPVILISCNLDSPFDSSIKHEVLFSSEKVMGPGVGENVIGLAVLPIIYRYLSSFPDIFNSNFLITATTGGLGNGNFAGMREIIKKFRNRLNTVITLRGIDLGVVGYQSPAMSRQILTVRAEKLKKAALTPLNNPICILSELISHLEDFSEKYDTLSSIKTSFFRGGNDFDGVPSIAALGLEMFSEGSTGLQEIQLEVENRLQQLIREENQYSIEVITSVLPGGIDREHVLLHQIEEIYSWLSKNIIPIRFRPDYSTSDASIPMSQDIPTLELGVTTGVNNRYLDDYINIKPILAGIKQVLMLTHIINKQQEF